MTHPLLHQLGELEALSDTELGDVFAARCADFLRSNLPALRQALEDAEKPKREDGDWYTLESGTHCIDFDNLPAPNQLSLLLKPDGTVSFVLKAGAASLHGDAMHENFTKLLQYMFTSFDTADAQVTK